jgi:nitrite reductase/ring-hydroxylating ferredoxin subunit
MWPWRSRWHPVAKVGDLAPGKMIAIAVNGLELVLGRDGERYFAVQRRCAHRGADLAAGFITNRELVCPQHGWRFSTATGKHGGIAEACLDVYAVRIVGDQIEIKH